MYKEYSTNFSLRIFEDLGLQQSSWGLIFDWFSARKMSLAECTKSSKLINCKKDTFKWVGDH